MKKARRPHAVIAHGVARSNTGHVGVSDTAHWKRGRRYTRIVATWRDDRHHALTRSFYYTTPGERRRALWAAIAARQRGLALRAIQTEKP